MGIKTIGRFVYDSSSVTSLAVNDSVSGLSSTVSNRFIDCDGTNIIIYKPGTYQILVNLTLEATAVGTIETQIYRNNTVVAGAHAVSTATAIGDSITQSYSTVLTVSCGTPTTINIKALTAMNLRIANIIINRIA